MFRLTVLLIATLSAVNAVDFTVGAEFETSKFKALGQFYRDDPLVETKDYIIHTDMGDEYFTVESATKGAINPDDFNAVFNAMSKELGGLQSALNKYAIWAKKIYTGVDPKKDPADRIDNLKKTLNEFIPFSSDSVLSFPKSREELQRIYQRFEEICGFWNSEIKFYLLEFNVAECNPDFVDQHIQLMNDSIESKEVVKSCGTKLNEIHKFLNNNLKLLYDFLLVYRRGIRNHDLDDTVDDEETSSPSLISLIQKGHIAWTNRIVRNPDQKQRRALMQYLCHDCKDDFGIYKETSSTVTATAHHTIGLKLAKVPQLFLYYQSKKFEKNFITFAGDEEVEKIVKNINKGMLINPKRISRPSHRERVKALIGNLNLRVKSEIENLDLGVQEMPVDSWNKNLLTQYVEQTKQNQQIQQCDKGQDAVGFNLLFLSYAINAFSGDIEKDQVTRAQLKKFMYGPKKALRLMSRVSFRKLYLGLQDCQFIFRNFFNALCNNNACNKMRLLAYQDSIDLYDDDEHESELKEFKGPEYQITLHQWYDSIVNGIIVQDMNLETSKKEMCSLKREAPRQSNDFNDFFDCEETDLLSPPLLASLFITKQALSAFFEKSLLKENPVKLATLNSYISKQHTSMGGYRNVEPDWIILENRAVARGLPLSISGRFADAHFKGIRQHVIEKDHFEDVSSSHNEHMNIVEESYQSADHQQNVGNVTNMDMNRLII